MKYRIYLYFIHLLVSIFQQLPFKMAVSIVFAIRKLVPKSSRVTWLVDRTPYKCLKKALMVVLVAHERPQVFFGVKKNEKGEIEAHAWTKIGGRFISGGAGHEAFSVIKVY